MVRVYWVPAITKQHGSLNQMSDIGGAAERLSTPAVAPLSFFGRSPKSIKGRQLETRRFHLALLVVNVSWLTESLLHLAFAPRKLTSCQEKTIRGRFKPKAKSRIRQPSATLIHRQKHRFRAGMSGTAKTCLIQWPISAVWNLARKT